MYKEYNGQLLLGIHHLFKKKRNTKYEIKGNYIYFPEIAGQEQCKVSLCLLWGLNFEKKCIELI